MKCPKCNGGNVYAHDTRHPADFDTRRRRVCADCGWSFSTIEIPLEEFKRMKREQLVFQHVREYLKQTEPQKGGSTDE